jgi:SagB-type dehydrogenase family enzyme
MIDLPAPVLTSDISIESTIEARRSVRDFSSRAPNLKGLSQLLWAAQGVTSRSGFRTAPSAGALYPLEIYLVAGSVKDLSPGVYRYIPAKHGLLPIKGGDHRQTLADAALSQSSIATAPVSLVIAAVYQRTAAKYGHRAERYVHIEAGHAGQNILLQAAAIELGTVIIAAFNDRVVQQVLDLPDGYEPISIIPTGFRQLPSLRR